MCDERVDILMPSYNAEATIAASIEGVLNQSHENLTLHVRDDCSTDGTWDIIEQYAKLDKRVHGKRNKTNLGVADNCNKILNDCRSNYVCFTAGDDVMVAHKIERQLNYFKGSPELKICFHDYYITNIKGEIIGVGKMRNFTYGIEKIHKMPIPTVTAMVRWGDDMPYRYNPLFPLADPVFFIDLLLGVGGKVGVLDEKLLYYQTTGNGLNAKSGDSNFQEKKLKIITQQISYCNELISKYPQHSLVLRKRIARLTAYQRKFYPLWSKKVAHLIKATYLKWDWAL